MPLSEHGSLTKEPPVSRIDATIHLIRPGMSMAELRTVVLRNARNQPRETAPHRDAPGLLRHRFLLVDESDQIVYDRLLSLAQARSLNDPLVRKVMYFVWAWRDDRIRAFITQVLADKSGRWSKSRATNKTRASFFAQYGQPSSAQKIRSNYEFFLTESGILGGDDKINLDTADGWLAEAAMVAAQHETDPAIGAALVRSPAEVLFQLGLNGLANLVEADRMKVESQGGGDFVQNEADAVLRITVPASAPREWKNREMAPPNRGTATALVNLVALERANASHLMLERLVAGALWDVGLNPQASESIDMLAADADHTLIFEIKSCTERNFHGQVRRGVSQLFEYRFLYEGTLKGDIVLTLVVETMPPRRKMWLGDYLKSLGITLVWKEHGTDRLLCAGSVPPPLAKLVTAI